MNKLFIDTSDNKKLFIALDSKGIKDSVLLESDKLVRSEKALPVIEKLLKRNGVNVEDIGKIEVNEGPGSFTGIRVGISIANALSFLLKIPVNDRKIGEFAKPVYNK